MIEQTINSLRGGYIALFIILSGIGVLGAALALIFTIFGTVGLVIISIIMGTGIFVYCLKTYEGFELSTFLNQRDAINGLNQTCLKQQSTLGKMLAHEQEQDQLISDMMLVLSVDEEENWSTQLSDARRVAARMKASIVAVRKV